LERQYASFCRIVRLQCFHNSRRISPNPAAEEARSLAEVPCVRRRGAVSGMIMPWDREIMPKSEFAGCMIVQEERIYPPTGKVEFGIPKWACQNPECRHRWW
jgi:hypothetical protein